jgi:hypothetical protein
VKRGVSRSFQPAVRGTSVAALPRSAGEAAMRRQLENANLDLAMTYSAYREIEMVPRQSLENVSQAILGLADNPMPEAAVMLEDAKGCYYLAVDGWYILYHLSDTRDALTVLGVLDGPEHTVH